MADTGNEMNRSETDRGYQPENSKRHENAGYSEFPQALDPKLRLESILDHLSVKAVADYRPSFGERFKSFFNVPRWKEDVIAKKIREGGAKTYGGSVSERAKKVAAGVVTLVPAAVGFIPASGAAESKVPDISVPGMYKTDEEMQQGQEQSVEQVMNASELPSIQLSQEEFDAFWETRETNVGGLRDLISRSEAVVNTYGNENARVRFAYEQTEDGVSMVPYVRIDNDVLIKNSDGTEWTLRAGSIMFTRNGVNGYEYGYLEPITEDHEKYVELGEAYPEMVLMTQELYDYFVAGGLSDTATGGSIGLPKVGSWMAVGLRVLEGSTDIDGRSIPITIAGVQKRFNALGEPVVDENGNEIWDPVAVSITFIDPSAKIEMQSTQVAESVDMEVSPIGGDEVRVLATENQTELDEITQKVSEMLADDPISSSESLKIVNVIEMMIEGKKITIAFDESVPVQYRMEWINMIAVKAYSEAGASASMNDGDMIILKFFDGTSLGDEGENGIIRSFTETDDANKRSLQIRRHVEEESGVDLITIYVSQNFFDAQENFVNSGQGWKIENGYTEFRCGELPTPMQCYDRNGNPVEVVVYDNVATAMDSALLFAFFGGQATGSGLNRLVDQANAKVRAQYPNWDVSLLTLNQR